MESLYAVGVIVMTIVYVVLFFALAKVVCVWLGICKRKHSRTDFVTKIGTGEYRGYDGK